MKTAEKRQGHPSFKQQGRSARTTDELPVYPQVSVLAITPLRQWSVDPLAQLTQDEQLLLLNYRERKKLDAVSKTLRSTVRKLNSTLPPARRHLTRIFEAHRGIGKLLRKNLPPIEFSNVPYG